MSRAFVKEPDGAEAAELPDRPISEHPNLVTPQGLARIEATLARLHEQHAQAQASAEKCVFGYSVRQLSHRAEVRGRAPRR